MPRITKAMLEEENRNLKEALHVARHALTISQVIFQQIRKELLFTATFVPKGNDGSDTGIGDNP